MQGATAKCSRVNFKARPNTQTSVLKPSLAWGGGAIVETRFSQPIQNMVLPFSLQQLRFGHSSNQHVDDVEWPARLQMTKFGWCFNQPLPCTKWPASPRLLLFGGRNYKNNLCCQELNVFWVLNKPPARVLLLDYVKLLSFEREFNQSIDDVAWPSSLQKLIFGWGFNQPIDHLGLPPSIRQ